MVKFIIHGLSCVVSGALLLLLIRALVEGSGNIALDARPAPANASAGDVIFMLLLAVLPLTSAVISLMDDDNA